MKLKHVTIYVRVNTCMIKQFVLRILERKMRELRMGADTRGSVLTEKCLCV